MTAKQQAFVLEYIKDKNAAAAAKRAGYADSTAEKQAALWVPGLGKSRDRCPDNYRAVFDAIKVAQAEAADRNGVDVDYLIGVFKTEAEGRGPDTTSAARIAAADKLAKHLGFYDEDNAQRAAAIVVDLTGGSDDD